MKLKISFLTILLSSLLCAMQAMAAAFQPENGKKYCLYSAVANAYLNATQVNNTVVSYQTTPTNVEIGVSNDGKYTLKIGSQYLAKGATEWDVVLQDNAYYWFITETNGGYYISRDQSANYLGNNGNCRLGYGIYCSGTTTNAVWEIREATPPAPAFDATKYYSFRTGRPNVYFKCDNNATILGADADGTTIYDEIDNFLWKVEGDDNNGYTIQNKATGLYILDPATIAAAKEVRMTNDRASASRYKFVNNQFQLTSNPSWYLASISASYNYISIYDNNNYTGSQIDKRVADKVTYTQGSTVVTGSGANSYLKAKEYITNTNGSYEKVPTDKVWQMEMVVEKASDNAPCYNQWGSCIIASTSDPSNVFYYNNFQVWQKKEGYLNFKSSKSDGNDHIIAESQHVSGSNYKVIVRYNAQKVYIVRTILLDDQFNETSQVYDDVWISAGLQDAIDAMSCALPEGINLKSLKISIAEESNLLEGVDYAIQNDGTNKYYIIEEAGTILTEKSTFKNSKYAADAVRFQVKFTGQNNLAYHAPDGALHPTMWIMVDVNGVWKYMGSKNTIVDTSELAQPFLYSAASKQIQPVTNIIGGSNQIQSELGNPWTTDNSDKWEFQFFANFLVEVSEGTKTNLVNTGGLYYKKGDDYLIKRNGEHIYLPVTLNTNYMSNESREGYMCASISKEDVAIKVNYQPLENTFYNFTDRTSTPNTTTLYYWYKPQSTLVTYSTTNSQSGQRVEWGERGDCSKFTIVKATTIPVKMNLNNTGSNADNKYYGTIYCPNALTLPNGVTAYRLNSISGDNYLLKPIEGNILAAATPAVLISDAANADDPSGNWTIDVNNTTTMSETNLFLGVFEDTTNPGSGQKASSPIYVLGNQPVNGDTNLGFYPYSAAKIPAFKAYHNTQSAQAPVRFLFTFDEGDESNAIRNHKQTSAPGNGIYYDLTGRAVGTPLRGHLYICNGKKVIY